MIFLKEPDPKIRKVDDFDFHFINGEVLPYTLDREAGDSMEYPTPDTIVLHFVPRFENDSIAKPAEDLTVYVKNLTHIVHRAREISDLTLSQKDQWQKTFNELNVRTIQ